MIRGIRLHDELDCRRTRRQLAAYADQALETGEREAVAGHLVGCEQCRSELAEMTQTRALLGIAARNSGPASAPSGLADRLVAIAGEQATDQLWLRPESDGQLPSRRRQVRQRALMGATVATMGLAGAMGAALLSAPELTQITDPDASRVASLGLPHVESAAHRAVLDELAAGWASEGAEEVPAAFTAQTVLVGVPSGGERVACPPRADCPEQLTGLPLVLRERLDDQPTTIRSTFTDRQEALVLVQQRGVLLAEAGRQGCNHLWQSGQWVYCLVLAHGDEDLAVQAEQELPHQAPVTGDVEDKLVLGLRSLVGERGR